MPYLKGVALSRKSTLLARWRASRDRGRQFPHEIDFVVLWVQDDVAHRAARNATAAHIQKKPVQQLFGFDNQNSRFRDNQELRSCLRSVFWCLPWVQRVHVVVADYQYPGQYVREDAMPPGYDGPEIRVVEHSAIMPTKHLPTFNSQAIESHLHRIPGLADRFIYANDDFYVGTQLDPSYFFTANTGAPRYNLEHTFIPDRKKTANMTKHSQAWTNNARVLNLLFGPTTTGNRNYPCHVMVPMLRKSFVEVWDHNLIRILLRRTSRSPFRTSTNLYPIGLLVFWNFYLHGARRRNHQGCLFHDVEEGDDVRGLMKFVLSSSPPLFCLNDGAYDSRAGRLIRLSLRAFYPMPAPWEPEAPVLPLMITEKNTVD
jgi:hypothetical protein